MFKIYPSSHIPPLIVLRLTSSILSLFYLDFFLKVYYDNRDYKTWNKLGGVEMLRSGMKCMVTWLVVEICSITHVFVVNGTRMSFFSHTTYIPKKT
jgi:hypothetical protein